MPTPLPPAQILPYSLLPAYCKVDILLEHESGAGALSIKPMFGEYGVYLDGKIIGLICLPSKLYYF
jgi:hypothetical protein